MNVRVPEDTILEQLTALQHALDALYAKRVKDYRTVNMPRLNQIARTLETLAGHHVFADAENFHRA